MKKVLAVALSGVMALSMLTACGDSESYHELTDKLNTAISGDYTYTDANSAKARQRYNEIIKLVGAWDSAIDDADDIDEDADESEQYTEKYGVMVALARRLGIAVDDIENVDVDNLVSDTEKDSDGNVIGYYVEVPVAKKNATEDEIVSEITSNADEYSEIYEYAQKGYKIGFFVNQDFSLSLGEETLADNVTLAIFYISK